MGSAHNSDVHEKAARDVLPKQRVPRWLVVSGLVVYCSVCWVAIWAAGSAGVQIIRTAAAGAN